MRQLDVQIMGQSYLLGCPDGGEAQLQSAVARVDGAMCKIRDAGKVRARDRIAVLAALNLAFDLDQAAPRAGKLYGADAAIESSPADAARINALLARLDAALGEDGRLL
jgi:cell division protein ZapA